MSIVLMFLWVVFFVLADEYVMGTVQRRIGPLVIGFYGILSSIINGINLMIAQFRIPKVHLNLGFKYFPIIFFSFSIFCFSMNYPFFFVDNSFSVLFFGIISFFGIIFLILAAFAGLSKYNMLGCMRLISQLLSYELVWSTIILGIILSFGTSLAITSFFNSGDWSKRWIIYYFILFIFFVCLVFILLLPFFLIWIVQYFGINSLIVLIVLVIYICWHYKTFKFFNDLKARKNLPQGKWKVVLPNTTNTDIHGFSIEHINLNDCYDYYVLFRFFFDVDLCIFDILLFNRCLFQVKFPSKKCNQYHIRVFSRFTVISVRYDDDNKLYICLFHYNIIL